MRLMVEEVEMGMKTW